MATVTTEFQTKNQESLLLPMKKDNRRFFENIRLRFCVQNINSRRHRSDCIPYPVISLKIKKDKSF